jgi:hypothetical protein
MPEFPLSVADIGANTNELIELAAKLLSNSMHRRVVFTEIYRGKQKVKTVDQLIESTGLPRTRVLDAGKSLAVHNIVRQTKVKGRTAYEKNDFYQNNRTRILGLAANSYSLEKYPTKRKPHFIGKSLDIRVDQFRVKLNQVDVKFITIDDIDSFVEVKKFSRGNEFIELPEKHFKQGVAKILGEISDFKDWGGEISDLYSSNIVLANRRMRVAFAFKGPGKRGSLTPGKLGKNGDQIQRLVESPADIYIIQYWMDIKESVISQFEKLVQLKSYFTGRKLWYGIIDGYDSARLIKAYPEAFDFITGKDTV